MRRTLFLLPLLIGSLLSSQTHEKIPLEKAIADGLRANHEYQISLLDLESAETERQIAAKNRLFNIDFGAIYRYQSETMAVEISPTQIPGIGTFPGRSIEAGLHHNFDLKLGLVQPLFTGGRLANAVKMEEVRRAVESNMRILKSIEITGRIKASYFQHLFLVRQKQSLMATKNTLELHRRRLENLLEEGLLRKTDLLETLSKTQEVELAARDVVQALESEKIQFQDLCGYLPEEIESGYKERALSRDEAVIHFQEHHPVLKTLNKKLDILDIQKKIVTGKRLPQVTGFAEIHYGKPGIDFFAKAWSLYFQGGISVNFNVFDWNKLGAEKELIEIEKEKVSNEKNQFIREVTKSLDQLFTALESLTNKLGDVDRLIAYSKEDTELKAALYAEGQIPNIDYLTSLLSQEKNVLLREEILIQIEQAKVRIHSLIGMGKEEG